MDLYSTTLELTGTGLEDGAAAEGPSRSLVPILSGSASSHDDDVVCSEQEETRTIRTPRWTYFKRFSGVAEEQFEDELYDVQADPEETINLADDPQFAMVKTDLDRKLEAFFRTNVRPEADLWNGGRPIQNSARVEFWQQAWGDQWSPVFDYAET